MFYVGDDLNDETSARRAGIAFAWARYGYQYSLPQNPDAVLERFEDVLKL